MVGDLAKRLAEIRARQQGDRDKLREHHKTAAWKQYAAAPAVQRLEQMRQAAGSQVMTKVQPARAPSTPPAPAPERPRAEEVRVNVRDGWAKHPIGGYQHESGARLKKGSIGRWTLQHKGATRQMGLKATFEEAEQVLGKEHTERPSLKQGPRGGQFYVSRSGHKVYTGKGGAP